MKVAFKYTNRRKEIWLYTLFHLGEHSIPEIQSLEIDDIAI